MQTSDDLPAASAAMFRELSVLYPETYISVIGSLDAENQVLKQWVVVAEDQSSDSYVGTKAYEGIRVAPEQFDLSAIIEAHPYLKDWLASIPNESTAYFIRLVKTAEQHRAIDRLVKSGQWTARQGKEHRAWWPGDSHFAHANHQYAYLFSWLSKPLTESEAEEYKRFTEVWAFACGRFLDLQQKEQRAREAEVEAALERVRAQALSMQTPEDLPSVSAALFREFNSLSFPVMNSSIGVLSEDLDRFDQWTVLLPGLEDVAEQFGTVYEEDPYRRARARFPEGPASRDSEVEESVRGVEADGRNHVQSPFHKSRI